MKAGQQRSRSRKEQAVQARKAKREAKQARKRGRNSRAKGERRSSEIPAYRNDKP